jgi:endonuclease/exonuclease/phosphatase (EEP) superfamily protein YafD
MLIGTVDLFFTISEALIVAVTLLPLWRSSQWWIRTWDFPRAQIAIIGATLLALDLTLRAEVATAAQLIRAALLLCLLYQAYKIHHYTIFSRKQVQRAKRIRSETTISLLLTNVLIENHNSARLREIIADADPDVVLAVETDAWWQRELAYLEQTHPFNVQQPQDNSYGMVLFSRLPLIRAEVRFLIQDDIPSIRAVVRLREGTEVEIHCLHPRPPVPQETAESTERDAELMVVGKEVKGKKTPIIVLGDLNDVAWSRTNDLFQKVSSLLDPRMGRGHYTSFNARYFFMRFPLDHFFHSAHFRLIELRRLPYFGSDHFPMYIRLSYEPEAESQQEPLPAEASDHAEAEEKIEEAASPSRS